MVKEYTYSPHVDFYIDMIDREHSYDMGSFHTHHKYELYYEVEGARRYFIEDSAYIVNAGNVILIGENQIHKTGSVGDGPTSRIVCNFSREYLQEISGAFPEIDLFSFMSEENNHLLSNITVKQQNYIYSILQQLIQMQDENSSESAVTRKMLLATLLLQLKKMCENQHELGGDSGRVTNRIVSQIQGYIAEHYAEKLTLTSIANQFYISPYYLSRLFKKTINLSLIEYINGVRIKAAQNMIEKTNESISSVAEKTGFMTSAHFRRVFKDATGLSPQQYRQYFKRVNKKTGSVGDGPTSRIVCNFSREYLQEISGAFPEIDLFSFMSEENNHLLSNITVKQQNYIYSILQQLIQMQDENSSESAVTRKMLLATLLLQLKKMCENQHELGGDSGRVTNRIVSQIQGYIAEHYAEKLTLTSIANQFYISPYYLSRLFKKTINLSLIEYINGVRIKAAQNMIEKTNESISSVAEKTGFMTSAHFRRVFKDATGLSPQQYRQYFKRVNKPEK